MNERELNDVVAAHGMADSDQRSGHLAPEVVDNREEVAGMIEPGGYQK